MKYIFSHYYPVLFNFYHQPGGICTIKVKRNRTNCAKFVKLHKWQFWSSKFQTLGKPPKSANLKSLNEPLHNSQQNGWNGSSRYSYLSEASSTLEDHSLALGASRSNLDQACLFYFWRYTAKIDATTDYAQIEKRFRVVVVGFLGGFPSVWNFVDQNCHLCNFTIFAQFVRFLLS